jgi:putative phosphoribosyl transferase
VFRDRADAGRQLAQALMGRALPDPIVLGLPRGGVEVAYQIARALHAPLDVISARKLGAPTQPELAIGAIAPGAVVLNEAIVRELKLSRTEIDDLIIDEGLEMQRRGALFRSGRAPLDLRGRTVILVDDGLATGATAAAAIQSIRRHDPATLILAVPVGARETIERLRREVDDVVVIEVPADFRAVGQWYDEFEQTSDERVIDLLRQAAPVPSDAPGA